jgi:hypothetical protein
MSLDESDWDQLFGKNLTVYGETVMDIHSKAWEQVDIARERYGKERPVWTSLVVRKMIEDSEDYDADVIEFLKELSKKIEKDMEKQYEDVRKRDETQND